MNSAATPMRLQARRGARRAWPVAALLALVLAAAGCSSSPSASGDQRGGASGHPTSTPSTSSTTTASGAQQHATKGTLSTTPAPEIKTATVTINGHVYPVPTDTSGKPVNPYNDTGQNIIVSDKGVLPYHLFANIGQPIVWTNLTSAPVQVTLIAYPVSSPLIPPGGTFSHTFQTSYSFSFQTSNGHLGEVDVGAFNSQ